MKAMAAAPAALAGAVKGVEAVGMDQTSVGTIDPLEGLEPNPNWQLREKMWDQWYQQNKAEIHMSESEFPVSVQTKKSWSPAFKHFVATQPHRRQEEFREAIEAAFNGNELDRMGALKKVAERFLK